MKCPCCGKEMISGVVQSSAPIAFTTKAHRKWFVPDMTENEKVLLSSHNWILPTSVAYHCADCKKAVIDY